METLAELGCRRGGTVRGGLPQLDTDGLHRPMALMSGGLIIVVTGILVLGTPVDPAAEIHDPNCDAP